MKDPQNGFKYGRLNQNFTLIADVGDNYEKNTCQWFVPNPIQNGASFITLTMGTLRLNSSFIYTLRTILSYISGDTTLQNGDGKIRKNSWRYRWIGTNDQRDCGIQIESTVDEDSGVWSYIHDGDPLNVNVTLLGTKL